MHKIEKELKDVTKVGRKDGESDQEFFTRLVDEGSKLFDKDETLWGKLLEGTQRWFNAASEAAEKGSPIPNYDGEVVEGNEEEGEGGEGGDAEVAEAEASESKDKKKKIASGKEKGKAKPVDKKEKVTAKAKDKEKPAAKVKADTKRAKANGADTEKRGPGRKGSFSPSDKIKKVASKNPFREGSKAAKCYEQYKVGRTVQQVLDAGVPRSKLNRHMSKGIVTIG